MGKKTPKRKSAANAPGQYLGFSLQATRFLVRLLEARDGDCICLEVFEDIGVEKRDGQKLAEQSKSNIASNPLADRSVAFWKCLANWINASSSGVLDPANTFYVLFVANPTAGGIAQSFHEAVSVGDAHKALDNARSSLGWTSRNADAIADSLRPHLQVVFTADAGVVARIISRFSLLTSARDNPLDDLRPLMLDKLVSEDNCENVIKWAHGWVKEKVDRLIGRNEPARVTQREFREAIGNYVRKHDRDDILRSVAGKPTDSNVSSELAFRIYVRQAQIITLDETDVLSAVNDFLMASSDRTNWAEEGHISREGVESYAGELARTWKNKKEKTCLAYSDKSETDRGRLLFFDCMEHAAKLEGLETPRHFTRGSFHALADDQTIGWHPDYVTELARVLDTSDKK